MKAADVARGARRRLPPGLRATPAAIAIEAESPTAQKWTVLERCTLSPPTKWMRAGGTIAKPPARPSSGTKGDWRIPGRYRPARCASLARLG